MMFAFVKKRSAVVSAVPRFTEKSPPMWSWRPDDSETMAKVQYELTPLSLE